jgi:hypothetical protein
MSSPQVATGDRIVDPTITLAGCSTRQRILVAGSKSVELMLELQRRACGAATGALGISIQSQVITGTMATGTISAGLASNGARYNGGSFGPCWTRTPIGPIWNCG